MIEASNRARAVALLAERGSHVTEIAESDGVATASTGAGARAKAGAAGGEGISFFGQRVPMAQRVAMFRQLAVALQAGLNLIPALQIVRQQSGQAGLRRLADELIERVQAGDPLSQAMAQHPKVFSLMQVSMVKAGETAGVLDEVMMSLARFAERDLELRQKLRSAATYPLMVIGLGGVSVLVILLFILPRIMQTVTETTGTAALPWPTRVLLGLQEMASSPAGWVVVLMVAGGAVWLWRWTRTAEGRLARDKFVLQLPVLGTAVRRVAVARFARTLGTLTKAGIQVVAAMRIVRDTLGNEAMAQAVDEATAEIVHGRSITEPLAESGYFPELLVQVIAMGERTGKLDELLLTTADAYDRETQAALERVMTVIPVLFILVLALVVGFILAAALLPIMTMDFGG